MSQRTRNIIGTILCLLGGLIGFVLIVLPVLPFGEGNPALMSIIAAVVCNPGDTFVQDFHTESDLRGTARGGPVYCVAPDETRTEVTDSLMVRAVLGMCIPFFAGLFLLTSKPKRRPIISPTGNAQVFTMPTTTFTSQGFSSEGFQSPQIEVKDGVLKVDGFEIHMDGIKPEHLKVFQSQSPIMMGGVQTSATTLAAKLKELQEARDTGLISGDEYERLRKEILDKMA
jgi:hypothetical protein